MWQDAQANDDDLSDGSVPFSLDDFSAMHDSGVIYT